MMTKIQLELNEQEIELVDLLMKEGLRGNNRTTIIKQLLDEKLRELSQ